MNSVRRIISYVVVALLAVYLWNAWFKDYPPAPPSKPVAESQSGQQAGGAKGSSQGNFVPGAYSSKQEIAPKVPMGNGGVAKKASPETKLSQDAGKKVKADGVITVRTDVIEYQISKSGGNVVAAYLLKYPLSLKDKSVPVQILSPTSKSLYVAQSGLTNLNNKKPILFSSEKSSYTLEPGQDQLVVTMKGKAPNGLVISKQYIFKPNNYAVRINYIIKSEASKLWSGNLYTQLVRRKQDVSTHFFGLHPYNGAAVSSPETPYEKISYKKMDEENLNRTNTAGWVAMQQHYFLSSWIPGNPNLTSQFYTHVAPSDLGNNVYTVGFVSPEISVVPGETVQTHAVLYVGPEIAKNLKPLAVGLDHTVDYGWLWWVAIVVFWLLNMVQHVVGNWGWAIVITTIIIKFILYPLSAASFRSMAKMRELQPRIKQLKDRFGDDRQALSKATMELYKKEKINPLGGCLPMLIQIPVFIALYYVLMESVELRQAPFIFWIHDLSVKDPYYVLPILMGISMLLQQKLTPTSADPAQAKMMLILPVVMTFIFLNFPAGLVLYWLVNNCVQMLQQWYVTKKLENKKRVWKK